MTLDVRAPARLQPIVLLAGAGVLAQIAFPLLHGSARARLTIAIVVLFAAVSLWHAAQTRGARIAAAVALSTIGVGFAVEVLGVATGLPFGTYAYSAALDPRLLGVPLVIGPAWTMLAWPAAVLARRLVRSFGARVALGAWALAAWDLFLDPQMVSAGYWHWSDVSTSLPGVPDVPLSDFAGWIVVAGVISYLLQRALRDTDELAEDADRLPVLVYVWTWASSTLALAVFLDLPAAAGYGALAMGTVAVPALVRLHRS